MQINDLFPELTAWDDGEGISVRSWIDIVGSHKHAIAYTTLFWPVFIEYDGCVFFKDRFSKDSYDGFLAQTEGNRQAVEALMNHIHINDLFYASNEEPSIEQIVYLGQILQEIWQSKLERDYPRRSFRVEFDEDIDTDAFDHEITFYQVKNDIAYVTRWRRPGMCHDLHAMEHFC